MAFNTGETLEHPFTTKNVYNDSDVAVGDSLADVLNGEGLTTATDWTGDVLPADLITAINQLAARVEVLEP